jgi:chromosome segregation ATPase
MSRITSAVSYAQQELNRAERELATLSEKLGEATANFDWTEARKLKSRKAELEEKLPILQANLLRVTYNEAQRAAEQRKQELDEAKRARLEATTVNTQAAELARNTNQTLLISSVNVAQAESKLAAANQELIEAGQNLQQHLDRLSQAA